MPEPNKYNIKLQLRDTGFEFLNEDERNDKFEDIKQELEHLGVPVDHVRLEKIDSQFIPFVGNYVDKVVETYPQE